MSDWLKTLRNDLTIAVVVPLLGWYVEWVAVALIFICDCSMKVSRPLLTCVKRQCGVCRVVWLKCWIAKPLCKEKKVYDLHGL